MLDIETILWIISLMILEAILIIWILTTVFRSVFQTMKKNYENERIEREKKEALENDNR